MVNVVTNLLKNRRTLSEGEYQRERAILRYSVLGLVVVVVLVLAMSLWILLLTSRLSEVESGIVKASNEMEGLVEANAKQVYLKSRLNLVTDFLGSREMARESLQKLFSTQIEGTHLAGAVFEDEISLAASYVAQEIFALERLLEYYQEDTEYFVQVVSRGITRTRDGNYQVSLLLTLPKGDK